MRVFGQIITAMAVAVVAAGSAIAQGSDNCEPEAMSYNCLRAEGYWAAQWAIQTSASEALSQVAARFASGTDELAGVVAARELLIDQLRAYNQNLYNALNIEDRETRESNVSNHRARIEELTQEFDALTSQIRRDYPEYSDLTNPDPLSVEATQALLRHDETLLLFLTGEDVSFVFIVDGSGIDWFRVEISAEQLAETVRRLREGLSPGDNRSTWTTQTAEQLDAPAFDRTEAFALYRSYFSPIEERIADKHHLYIVTSGALTSLPLGVLVTSPPQGEDSDPASLVDTNWLARHFAMTVLPAPSSLRSLARFGATQAQLPFFGIGSPCIGTHAGANCSDDATTPEDVSSSQGLGSERHDRGVFIANSSDVSGLRYLANARAELMALAHSLNASPANDLLIESAATEAAVRSGQLDLANRRVIAFATHGLISDDIPNLREPALVMTPPGQSSAEDDGLLTASEIAADLHLDADWVILSACNTASPDGVGAESLSGLARAFFYAGARSLLVSHWPVNDAAARQITTRAIGAMSDDPSIGRAQALRLSLVSLMDDERFADPAMWAPFVLVGENRPVGAVQ